MVDSKGNPSVPAKGQIDDLMRGHLADRDSVHRTEGGDKTGQNQQAKSSDKPKPAGKSNKSDKPKTTDKPKPKSKKK